MTAPGRVGIVGCYGGVGRAAVDHLRTWGLGPLRLGGRSRESLEGCAASAQHHGEELLLVDVEDAQSLADFCAGCAVVVNCAGPSCQIQYRVAEAALDAGADYVDVGGEQSLHAWLEARDPAAAGRTAVIAAGMVPGLSGLLARLLVAEGVIHSPTLLEAYAGGLSRFTLAGAADYLASAGAYPERSLAAWSGGEYAARSLTRLVNVELPFFPGRVTAHPYLSLEAERLACALSLPEVRWYNVFTGENLLRALATGRGSEPEGLRASSEALMCAAELDLVGRTPFQSFVYRLEGDTSVGPLHRTLVLRVRDASQATGAVAALTALAVSAGEVAPGGHFAAEVLEPHAVLERLRGARVAVACETFDGPSIDTAVEEGVL
jgi:Saccharopine dehydrogenase NADP binding domain